MLYYKILMTKLIIDSIGTRFQNSECKIQNDTSLIWSRSSQSACTSEWLEITKVFPFDVTTHLSSPLLADICDCDPDAAV